MIKLSSLLSKIQEEHGYITINPIKIQNIQNKHFSIGLMWEKNGVMFFRGSASKTEYKKIRFVNPKLIKRKSKDSYNLYYILMDTLPSWKEFPKRSRSIIFTNSKSVAEEYNYFLNILYPSNRAKIAAGEYNDFLVFPYIFKRIEYRSIDTFSRNLTSLLSKIGKVLNNDIIVNKLIPSMDEVDWKSALKEFEKIDILEVLNSKSLNNRLSFIETYLKEDMYKNLHNNNLVDYIDKLMNPEKNEIYLLNVDAAYRFISNRKDPMELWTDSFVMLKGIE